MKHIPEYMRKPDGLALEYKRDYGIARGNINIADFMNNPNFFGVTCVFGPGFSEELADLPFVETGVVSNDVSDPCLILED